MQEWKVGVWVSLLIVAAPVWAVERDQATMGGMMGSGRMMHESGSGMMNMDAMRDDMAAMNALMQKLQRTTDPAERLKLMDDHMRQMQNAMQKMHGLIGAPHVEGEPGMSMEQRQTMLERRMDMMQQMMDQMMRHMGAQQ